MICDYYISTRCPTLIVKLFWGKRSVIQSKTDDILINIIMTFDQII